MKIEHIKNYWCLIILIMAMGLVNSCQMPSEYEITVERELSRGVRVDSLFLGFHFGMLANDFYDRCWELNKEGRMMEGASNATVHMEIEGLDYPASMDFYPAFDSIGHIIKMPLFVKYNNWAPWNKHLYADKLILDLVDLYKKQYGDKFIQVVSPTRGTAHIHIDGNRQITLFHRKEDIVEVLFVDLLNQEQNPRRK